MGREPDPELEPRTAGSTCRAASATRSRRLIGAEPGEVVVADSTSVNLFKLLAAALALQTASAAVICRSAHNFPTDLYIAEGLIELLGNRHELRLVDGARSRMRSTADTALVC